MTPPRNGNTDRTMTETAMHRILMTAAALGLAATPALVRPALAQPASPGFPPGINSATGARPGNDIGTGQSLPLGNTPSNITPGDTRSEIAPRLPAPPGGQSQTTREFLMDASRALANRKTGMTQEALERAETRALDRSVNPLRANDPSRQPVVHTITEALNALAAHDFGRVQQLIDVAMTQAPPEAPR